VWAQVATGIQVTGCPQFPHPESLLGVEGYTCKYKSGGGEASNEAGAVTLNFCKEKLYASSTTTKPEKLLTANKAVAALMRALAVFELLTVENRGCSGFALSHRAPHPQQPWSCGVKGELRGLLSAC